MIGVLDTCECGRKFLRGIYPQKKCPACDAGFVMGNNRETIIPAKMGEKGKLCISPMLRSEVKEIKFKMKKLVTEGVFDAQAFCNHRWLYFNYEKYCRVCERLEFFWDKIWKACNPPKQVKTLMTSKKLSDVLSLREIRELPVVLDSEGNMKLIKEAK